jgi:hypothetical protein
MSKTAIRNQIQLLKKKIEKSPRVWRFRGRRVIPIDSWTLEDWTTFPDAYHIALSLGLHPPAEWEKDYLDLLWELEDATYAWQICTSCPIHKGEEMKKEMDRMSEHWEKQGGKEKFYDRCAKSDAERFRRQDAIEQVKFRILNEHAGARNRTCTTLNFFKCPYGEEYQPLINAGRAAEELLDNLDYYHSHWHRDPSLTPAQNQMKWYHFGEPEIVDVTNYDDVKKAATDGRMQKIATEREAYYKAMA